MVTPQPGIYHDVPFENYVAWEAVNQSALNGMRRTPAHVRYELDHGGIEPTEAMDRGALLHLAALEPDRFEAEVVAAPKIDRRYKKGKEMWAEFEATNAGKQIVTDAEYAKNVGMSRGFRQHQTCAEFLSGRGRNEVSIVWTDAETGLLCKARIDRVSDIGGWPVVGDLKTSRSASRSFFQRSVERYGYHVQAAHYLAGLEALVPIPDGRPYRRFFFFVVESEAPYLAAAYEIDDEALDEGTKARSRYLDKWKRCVESGVWPGYPEHEYVGLPPWAYRSYIDE